MAHVGVCKDLFVSLERGLVSAGKDNEHRLTKKSFLGGASDVGIGKVGGKI